MGARAQPRVPSQLGTAPPCRSRDGCHAPSPVGTAGGQTRSCSEYPGNKETTSVISWTSTCRLWWIPCSLRTTKGNGLQQEQKDPLLLLQRLHAAALALLPRHRRRHQTNTRRHRRLQKMTKYRRRRRNHRSCQGHRLRHRYRPLCLPRNSWASCLPHSFQSSCLRPPSACQHQHRRSTGAQVSCQGAARTPRPRSEWRRRRCRWSDRRVIRGSYQLGYRRWGGPRASR